MCMLFRFFCHFIHTTSIFLKSFFYYYFLVLSVPDITCIEKERERAFSRAKMVVLPPVPHHPPLVTNFK